MNGRCVTHVPDEHLGDRAELYALGVLDADEADHVNAHAARCAECARLVGAAERAVMTLDAATVSDVAAPPELERRIAAIGRVTPLRRKAPLPRSFARWGALAASLSIVAGGAAGTRGVLHMHDVVAQDDAALAVIAKAHFKHANFLKADPGAPTAKVLWGLSNRWIYVIVDSSGCACRIAAITDAGERDLGVPLGRGVTAALFANHLPPVRRVELRRDGRITASATLR
jgi:hypothetical protein